MSEASRRDNRTPAAYSCACDNLLTVARFRVQVNEPLFIVGDAFSRGQQTALNSFVGLLDYSGLRRGD